MFRMKVYNVGKEVLVAVCDSDLVGETFCENNYKIEITEKFYGAKEVDEEAVRKALMNATIANLSGEKSVKLAIQIGIVEEGHVLKIGRCWHAQMVVL